MVGRGASAQKSMTAPLRDGHRRPGGRYVQLDRVKLEFPARGSTPQTRTSAGEEACRGLGMIQWNRLAFTRQVSSVTSARPAFSIRGTCPELTTTTTRPFTHRSVKSWFWPELGRLRTLKITPMMRADGRRGNQERIKTPPQRKYEYRAYSPNTVDFGLTTFRASSRSRKTKRYESV